MARSIDNHNPTCPCPACAGRRHPKTRFKSLRLAEDVFLALQARAIATGESQNKIAEVALRAHLAK